MAQLMPLPLTVSCSSKIQIGFTFLVPAHPGSPGKEAVKWLLLFCCYTYLCYCSGFFDIYNEEKGNMDQHAVSILNVSVTLVYLTVFTVSLIKHCICMHALVIVKLELCFINYMPSVLSHCWFGIRKSIQPVKK